MNTKIFFLFKKTFLFLAPFKKQFLVVLGFVLIGQILALINPYILGKMTDFLQLQNYQVVIGLVILSGIIRVVANYLDRQKAIYRLKRIFDVIENYIGEKGFEKYLAISIGQHHQGHSHLKNTAISNGRTAMRNTMLNTLDMILPSLIQIVLLISSISLLSPILGMTAFTILAVQLIMAWRLNTKMFEGLKALTKISSEYAKQKGELFSNVELILSNGQSTHAVSLFKKDNDTHHEKRVTFWRPYWEKISQITLFGNVGQYVLFGITIGMIYSGHFSVGIFLTMTWWINSLFGCTKELSLAQRQTLQDLVDIDIFFQAIETESLIPDTSNGYAPDTISGDILFDEVSYAYPKKDQSTGGKEILKNISFSIVTGQTVGIVGRSGSGKTTLLNMLRRYFDPSKGAIYIDGIPLTEYNLSHLLGRIGSVSQDILVFDKTIRENILFAVNRAVSDEEIFEVLEKAQLHVFVKRLPLGLDTYIGERGIRLSGGERQRLAIARAIIKNPDIFIFDEATSSLDSENESLIHEAIKVASQGKTTIIIAHRLSTVRNADRILVMKEGEIVGQGTHEYLIATCDEYRTLARLQTLEDEIRTLEQEKEKIAVL